MTMVVPGKFEGSFQKPDTREVLRTNVVAILKLSEKGEPEKREPEKRD
jgi:hypothetical protein